MFSTNSVFRENALPDVVQRHVLGACGSEELFLPRHQRLRGIGEVRKSPSSRWRAFRATHDVDLTRAAIRWSGRFPITPGCWFDVVDRCDGTEGTRQTRLWGALPWSRSTEDDLAVDQVARYLVELPWSPHAILGNTFLHWRAITDLRVEVSTRVRGERIAARLEFDGESGMVFVHIPNRPRLVGGKVFRLPWFGTFSAYESIGGIRIPAVAEAAWGLPDGMFTYWRGMVTSVEFLD